MITITTYRSVPSFARGLVRDLRVRWALEEAGLSYDVKQIEFAERQSETHRARQPFCQIPTYEEDGNPLFESGAIVLHIAEKSEALMRSDPHARARVICWLFAALNTVEPPIVNLCAIDLFYPDQEWAKSRRPGAEGAVRKKLTDLSQWLDGRDYLEAGRFTAADLLMASVLRILRHTDLVAQTPGLDAYLRRCEARPAFQKALADHLASFVEPSEAV